MIVIYEVLKKSAIATFLCLAFLSPYVHASSEVEEGTLDLRGKVSSAKTLDVALEKHARSTSVPIKSLDLSNNSNFGSLGVNHLIIHHRKMCEGLETLRLNKSNLDINVLSNLQKMLNLKRLEVSDNPQLQIHKPLSGSGSNLPPLSLAHLEVLEARNIGEVAGLFFEMHVGFPELRSLNLSLSHEDSSDDLVGSVLTDFLSMRNIQELILDGRRRLTITSVGMISETQTLQHLSLNNCQLQDADIAPLYMGKEIGGVTPLQELTVLELSRNGVNGTGVLNLCTYLPKLQSLNLKDQNPGFSDYTKMALTKIFGQKIKLDL